VTRFLEKRPPFRLPAEFGAERFPLTRLFDPKDECAFGPSAGFHFPAGTIALSFRQSKHATDGRSYIFKNFLAVLGVVQARRRALSAARADRVPVTCRCGTLAQSSRPCQYVKPTPAFFALSISAGTWHSLCANRGLHHRSWWTYHNGTHTLLRRIEHSLVDRGFAAACAVCSGKAGVFRRRSSRCVRRSHQWRPMPDPLVCRNGFPERARAMRCFDHGGVIRLGRVGSQHRLRARRAQSQRNRQGLPSTARMPRAFYSFRAASLRTGR